MQKRQDSSDHAFILEYGLLHEGWIISATKPVRHDSQA